MKLLINDTDPSVCKKAMEKLQSAGISCTLREPQTAMLFDNNNKRNQHEVWITDDSDFDTAWQLLNGDQAEPEDEPG